jgi:hypothetical protein
VESLESDTTENNNQMPNFKYNINDIDNEIGDLKGDYDTNKKYCCSFNEEQ